jgi:predicted nucleic acid-binding protein
MIVLDTNVLSALMRSTPDPLSSPGSIDRRQNPLDYKHHHIRGPLRAGGFARRQAAPIRPADLRDTLVAGIVVARRAALATRNVKNFGDVPVVDPWEE